MAEREEVRRELQLLKASIKPLVEENTKLKQQLAQQQQQQQWMMRQRQQQQQQVWSLSRLTSACYFVLRRCWCICKLHIV